MPAFVGLDLAWTATHETGICILEGESGNVGLARLDCRVGAPDDFAGLCKSAGNDVVAAIDAPLIVAPERRAESELGKVFGKYKASAYSANLSFLTKMAGLAGPQLAWLLRGMGFDLDPARLTPRANGRFAIEVFPHPAHVVLFGLAERLPYKKGAVAKRRHALRHYQRHLVALLGRELPRVLAEPEVRAILDPGALAVDGAALKRLEDTLDGLTCACVAYHCWLHGTAGFQVFGCADHGCIVVPRLAPTSDPAPTSP